MRVPQTSLRAFLRAARDSLHSCQRSNKPTTFVIGNQAADLDSICATIFYAYLRTSSLDSTSAGSSSFHVPIVSVPRHDLRLRPELAKLLPLADVAVSDLITVDELPDINDENQRIVPDLSRWVLIDHNALHGELGTFYSDRVVGCIDHHVDEGGFRSLLEDEPHIITKCGSCASLVTEYIGPAWDRLIRETDAEATRWNAQVALLALAPILVDTGNLAQGHITTDRDISSADYLEAKIRQCQELSIIYDRDTFHLQLVDAKRDIENLTVMDVFCKDYKEWAVGPLKLGTSAVEKSVEYLMNKAEAEDSPADAKTWPSLAVRMQQFAADRNMAIHALLTAVYPDNRKPYIARELVIFSEHKDGSQIVKRFLEQSGKDLGLQEVFNKQLDGNQLFACWRQENLAESRKGVAPRLRNAMKSGV